MTDPDMLELCEAKREEFVLRRVKIKTHSVHGAFGLHYKYPVDEFMKTIAKAHGHSISMTDPIIHIWSVTKEGAVNRYYDESVDLYIDILYPLNHLDRS